MKFFKLLNFILFEFLIASLLKNLHLQFMQNDDKSTIGNLNNNSRGYNESRGCQERQRGQSSERESDLSEEIEDTARPNSDSQGPKDVMRKSSRIPGRARSTP